MREELSRAVAHLQLSDRFFDRPQLRWTDDDLRRVQAETKLRVPTDVGDIYKEYGRIGLAETELYFRGWFPDKSSIVGEVQILFVTMERLLEYHETFIKGDEYQGRVDPYYLFFSTADGGNGYLLVDGRQDDSPIYFWPLAYDPLGEGDNARGLAKVADSLPEFLLSLRTADELG